MTENQKKYMFKNPSGQQFVKVAEDHNEKKNKRMHELRFFP